jgi:hypothetical protein
MTNGTPQTPAPEPGESQEQYLIRCTALLEEAEVDPGEAATACEEAWDNAQPLPPPPPIWPPLPLLPPVVVMGPGIAGRDRIELGGSPPPELELPPWTPIKTGGWSGPGDGPPDGSGLADGADSEGTGNPVKLDGWSGPGDGPPDGTGQVAASAPAAASQAAPRKARRKRTDD